MITQAENGFVSAVSLSGTHTMSKQNQDAMFLVTGLGVEGDAHNGATVKHRSRVARDPNQPNLRQVHLIHAELHDELRAQGFDLRAGQMGENITTRGIALLTLPQRARLHLGASAVIEITGLRNPCAQLDGIQQGLMKALVMRDADSNIVRKAGIMAIVLQDGIVKPGDAIRVELPHEPHQPLEPI